MVQRWPGPAFRLGRSQSVGEPAYGRQPWERNEGQSAQKDLFFSRNSSKVYLDPRPSMVQKLSLCCKVLRFRRQDNMGISELPLKHWALRARRAEGQWGEKKARAGAAWEIVGALLRALPPPHLAASAPSQCESSGVLLVLLIELASYVCFED